jgi:hypothetical protein
MTSIINNLTDPNETDILLRDLSESESLNVKVLFTKYKDEKTKKKKKKKKQTNIKKV